jgi:hypothetical protein
MTENRLDKGMSMAAASLRSDRLCERGISWMVACSSSGSYKRGRPLFPFFCGVARKALTLGSSKLVFALFHMRWRVCRVTPKRWPTAPKIPPFTTNQKFRNHFLDLVRGQVRFAPWIHHHSRLCSFWQRWWCRVVGHGRG